MDILKIFVYKHESYCLKEKKKATKQPTIKKEKRIYKWGILQTAFALISKR